MTTRDALVRASADLIAEQGTAAFSLRKVAERVGIKAPSIYVHFDDKEALAEAGRYAAQVLGAFLHGECQGRDARTLMAGHGDGLPALRPGPPIVVRAALHGVAERAAPPRRATGPGLTLPPAARAQCRLPGYGT